MRVRALLNAQTQGLCACRSSGLLSGELGRNDDWSVLDPD
jgi:hypothetical protein